MCVCVCTYCICFPHSRHSDVNLTEVTKEAVKDEEKDALLEAGGMQTAASPTARNPSTSSPLIRCVKGIYFENL